MKKIRSLMICMSVVGLHTGIFAASAEPVAEPSDQGKVAIYGLSGATYLSPATSAQSAYLFAKRWRTPPKEVIYIPPLFYYVGLPIFMTLFSHLLIYYIRSFESDQRIKSFEKPWVDFD